LAQVDGGDGEQQQSGHERATQRQLKCRGDRVGVEDMADAGTVAVGALQQQGGDRRYKQYRPAAYRDPRCDHAGGTGGPAEQQQGPGAHE
jgi:hypothetical protein